MRKSIKIISTIWLIIAVICMVVVNALVNAGIVNENDWWVIATVIVVTAIWVNMASYWVYLRWKWGFYSPKIVIPWRKIVFVRIIVLVVCISIMTLAIMTVALPAFILWKSGESLIIFMRDLPYTYRLWSLNQNLFFDSYWMKKTDRVMIIPSIQISYESERYSKTISENERKWIGIEVLWLNRWCAIEIGIEETRIIPLW